MERFAVGINKGVFDEDTFYDVAGRTTIELYQKIEIVLNTIKHLNINNNNNNEFCPEYRKLYSRIEKRCRSGILRGNNDNKTIKKK